MAIISNLAHILVSGYHELRTKEKFNLSQKNLGSNLQSLIKCSPIQITVLHSGMHRARCAYQMSKGNLKAWTRSNHKKCLLPPSKVQLV